MRFEQLKRDPNTVVKKKLYKSGRKWVVMSSIAIASGIVLLGSGGVPVQADSGNGSSVVSSQNDDYDESDRVDGEKASDGWITYDWAVYKINHDSNHLKLVIGKDGTTFSNISADATDTTEWSKYSANITEIDVIGKLEPSKNFIGWFSDLPNLKEIKGLDNIDTSKVTNMSQFFQGDTNLTSVDISSWDMSGATTGENFANSGITSITLGKHSVLSANDLSTTYKKDNKIYKVSGWQNTSDPSDVLTPEGMAGKYTTDNTQDSNITWTPVGDEVASSYYIQYADKDGNPLFNDTDTVYPGVLNDAFNLTSLQLNLSNIGHLIAGYSADKVINETGIVTKDENGNLVAVVRVPDIKPVNISVSQKIGNDDAKDVSFTIPVNDTAYKYTDINDPSNSKIDLDKSTIKVGDKDAVSFKDYNSGTDLNSILSKAIDSLKNSSGVLGDSYGGQTPITVNAVYTKNSTSGGGSSSGGNSSNNNNNEDNNSDDNNGTVTKLKQTVGTTTKTVNLYDRKGKLVTNRALGKNTGWLSDQEYKLNGTLYYRVATDEYVKVSDVYVYVADKRVVHVHNNQLGYLVDYKGDKITNRALKSDTDWVTDKYTMINGQKYYRVAINEFVSAADVSLI